MGACRAARRPRGAAWTVGTAGVADPTATDMVSARAIPRARGIRTENGMGDSLRAPCRLRPVRPVPYPAGVRRSLVPTFFVLGTVLSVGCAEPPVRSGPSGVPSAPESERGAKATAAFWTALHGSLYARLDGVTDELTAVYVDDPGDAGVALLLAQAHAWRVAERRRLESPDPRVADSLVLAESYFERAQSLSPGDDRISGWLGGIRLAIGDVHQDARATARGYADLEKSPRRWPAFNGFTVGYAMMQLPPNHRRYDDGLAAYWRAAEACAGSKLDRSNPDFSDRVSAAAEAGGVCRNGWIAPHAFEGFFMAMGDAVLKTGEVSVARRLYQNAKLVPTYTRWPYRKELEERLKGVDARAKRYADGESSNDPLTMAETEYACTGCHAGDVSTYDAP